VRLVLSLGHGLFCFFLISRWVYVGGLDYMEGILNGPIELGPCNLEGIVIQDLEISRSALLAARES
jgi:hypothetical protein